MRRSPFLSLTLLSCLVLSACSEGEMYFRFHQIRKGEWGRDSTLVFTIDSLPAPSSQRMGASIEITHSNAYRYEDLWLFIDQNLADSVFRRDTLRVTLADGYGKWIGAGVGGLHQLSVPYREGISFDPRKKYRISIRQAMHADPLVGIEKIGVKITGAPTAR